MSDDYSETLDQNDDDANDTNQQIDVSPDTDQNGNYNLESN